MLRNRKTRLFICTILMMLVAICLPQLKQEALAEEILTAQDGNLSYKFWA